MGSCMYTVVTNTAGLGVHLCRSTDEARRGHTSCITLEHLPPHRRKDLHRVLRLLKVLRGRALLHTRMRCSVECISPHICIMMTSGLHGRRHQTPARTAGRTRLEFCIGCQNASP